MPVISNHQTGKTEALKRYCATHHRGSAVHVTTRERAHAQQVEAAMLHVMAWMIRGKYRSLIHRHDGFWRAIDEAEGVAWNAASLVDLVSLMQNPNTEDHTHSSVP